MSGESSTLQPIYFVEENPTMKQIALVALTATMLVAGVSSAQTWKIDRAHSRVEFSVTHLLISEVTGRFTDYDISFTQGKDDFSGSTIVATIKAASVNTDNEMRDKDLLSDNFFNAATYPVITFKSTSFEKTGDNTYDITGDLTIRDVTKPVTLSTKLLGTITDNRGNVRVGFRAACVINRFDYGVRWSAKLDKGGYVVSEDAHILISTEFVRQK
jgi:polyisoprenoid-binding protein YceI